MAGLSFVEQVIEARFDRPISEIGLPDRHLFLGELLSFHRASSPESRSLVTAAAIRNWVIPRGTPPRTAHLKRRPALEFLFEFADWAQLSGKIRPEKYKRQFAELCAELRSLLELGQSTFSSRVLKYDDAGQFINDPIVLSAVQSIVFASSKNLRSEREDLFPGGAENGPDESYFLLYRYSTNHGTIVKSLIQVNTPPPNSDTYSFNHYIWCTRNYDQFDKSLSSRPAIFRECEGVIAKFDKAYYFIGYNFTIPIDRVSAPARYKTVRNEKKQNPSGIGIITFEYDAFKLNPGILSAVTLTLAASDQPLVARAALLHLGTRHSFGERITDDLARPGEIEAEKLESDLYDTIRHLEQINKSGLSEHFMTIFEEGAESGVKRISAHIEKLIDNLPAWERRKTRRPNPRCRGAIETFGFPQRPRD